MTINTTAPSEALGHWRVLAPSEHFLPPAVPGPGTAGLGWWSRAWRYLAVLGAGLALWTVVVVELLPDSGGLEDAPEAVAVAVTRVLVVDLLLGVVAACLLPLRRRRPVPVAAVTAALTTLSASAIASAALATISMSTRRRRRTTVAAVGVLWLLAPLANELWWWPTQPGETDGIEFVLGGGVLALVVYAACVATGSYVGARRELVVSLRERAVTAERQRELESGAAREAERTRIAREMHDVLAHRISLVALHAGALAYRSDLTREQTVAAAGTITHNAQLALAELRQVLGVLRAGAAGPDGLAEPPQPTLAELPALLADAAEAGAEVHLDVTGLPGADLLGTSSLSEVQSRTAFRVVQEALTNARKHAPGAPVRLRLAGPADGHLHVEARNRVEPDDASATAGGMGLMGLVERAELAGGRLRHGREGDDFVVRAWLSWR